MFVFNIEKIKARIEALRQAKEDQLKNQSQQEEERPNYRFTWSVFDEDYFDKNGSRMKSQQWTGRKPLPWKNPIEEALRYRKRYWPNTCKKFELREFTFTSYSSWNTISHPKLGWHQFDTPLGLQSYTQKNIIAYMIRETEYVDFEMIPK